MGPARQKDNMENRDLRRRRALSVLTFDATNVPLDGAIVTECAVQRDSGETW